MSNRFCLGRRISAPRAPVEPSTDAADASESPRKRYASSAETDLSASPPNTRKQTVKICPLSYPKDAAIVSSIIRACRQQFDSLAGVSTATGDCLRAYSIPPCTGSTAIFLNAVAATGGPWALPRWPDERPPA
jgi:hypothetical protein